MVRFQHLSARQNSVTMVAAMALVLGLLVPVRAAQAAPEPAMTGAEVPGRYIVVLADDAPLRSTISLHQSLFEVTPHLLYRFALTGYSAEMDSAAARALKERPEVAWVEPDRVNRIAAQTVPTGVNRVEADHSSVAAIDGVDQRVNVDVAILDTGADLDHPDLNINRTGARSCVAAQPTAQDLHGHGTHVSGIVGALDNSIGVAGVAPGARIWPVKVLTDIGAGLTSETLCGIDYVTRNADVIEVANMSIGSTGLSRVDWDDGNCGRTRGDAYHSAICASVAAGVTYVVAAGNDHTDARYSAPAAYDEVITVSALADGDGVSGALGGSRCGEADDTFADYSNFGGDIDLIAPGNCIYSTLPLGRYGTMSGTSMASPHVAGAAALHAAGNPNDSPLQVKNALISRGSQDWTWPSQDGDNIKEPLAYVADAPPASTAPAPSPTPTPTPTPAASPTFTPTPSPSESATPTETPSESPSPDSSPTPSPTPSEGGTGDPSPTPSPSASATTSPSPSSTPRPGPTSAPSPAPTTQPPADTRERRSVGFDLVKHLVAKGRVWSESQACVSRVKVKIQRKASGRWVTIRSVVSQVNGAFRRSVPDRPGIYRAKVPADDSCVTARSVRWRHKH